MRIPKQNMPGCALILDEYLVQEAYDIRSAHGNPPHDEVWEGLLILKPLPDNQHQSILARIQMPIMDCCSDDKVRFGVNITDRHPDWLYNFRCPDFVIYKRENPAVCHDMYWLGGPDFLIEVIMPNDLSRDKLPFYAKVSTREVLIVDRDPWTLELYHLQDGVLELAGQSNLTDPAVLTSRVLPLTFQLLQASPRPIIHMAHTSNGQTWTA